MDTRFYLNNEERARIFQHDNTPIEERYSNEYEQLKTQFADTQESREELYGSWFEPLHLEYGFDEETLGELKNDLSVNRRDLVLASLGAAGSLVIGVAVVVGCLALAIMSASVLLPTLVSSLIFIATPIGCVLGAAGGFFGLIGCARKAKDCFESASSCAHSLKKREEKIPEITRLLNRAINSAVEVPVEEKRRLVNTLMGRNYFNGSIKNFSPFAENRIHAVEEMTSDELDDVTREMMRKMPREYLTRADRRLWNTHCREMVNMGELTREQRRTINPFFDQMQKRADYVAHNRFSWFVLLNNLKQLIDTGSVGSLRDITLD